MIFKELIGGKYLCDTTDIILWYIIYVGSWVLGWKSLKPSRKTLRCGCMGLVLPLGFVPKDTGLVLPLGMSPKRHGVWLALWWCPKIVIIILIMYLVEHWYLMCRLLGVNSLSIVKGWMKLANTCIHVWHDYTFVNGCKKFIIHAFKCLIQGF